MQDNTQCTGYEQAYFNQQCQYNPQYDEQCPDMLSVVETDIEDIIDDGTGTGEVVDSVIEARRTVSQENTWCRS